MPPIPKIERWVCPVHGIVDEGELIQGQDGSSATPDDPDGWTEDYYCPDPEHDEPLRCEFVKLVVRAA